MDAHFLKGLLEQEGINVVIQGEALEGAWGNMPVSATSLPGVWAGGDCVAGGQDLTVSAVEDGKQAARSIIAALAG